MAGGDFGVALTLEPMSPGRGPSYLAGTSVLYRAWGILPRKGCTTRRMYCPPRGGKLKASGWAFGPFQFP